jgi:NodT family efflux transporter outer membrane factor (OMF) lipoprotein
MKTLLIPMRIFLGRLILFLFILCMMIGCSTSKPVPMPNIRPQPAKFSGGDTSSSIGTISWRKFFEDQYLVSLIDEALIHNPDLLIAFEQTNIARTNLSVANGLLLPSLRVIASGGADKFGDYTMNGVGNFDTNLSPNIDKNQQIPTHPTPDYFIGLRSSWEIDIWGKLKNQKKSAISRLLASEKGRQFLLTNLVAEVAGSYFELLALDYELLIINKNIQLQEAALELVKVQKEGGRATELAVQQFQAQVLHTQALSDFTLQQINLLENHMNNILGRYPQHIMRDSNILSKTLPSSLMTGLPTAMLMRRPDIQQAELELAAAKTDVLAARAAFLPTLTFDPYVGMNAFRLNVLFDPASFAWGFVAGLMAPIYDHNRIKAGYGLANANNKIAIYQYQKILLSSYGEVNTILKGINYNNDAFRLKQEEVKALSSAVATANDLYMTGYATYLEVVTAQKGVLEAELQLTGVKKQLFQSVIDLYHALGGGWE